MDCLKGSHILRTVPKRGIGTAVTTRSQVVARAVTAGSVLLGVVGSRRRRIVFCLVLLLRECALSLTATSGSLNHQAAITLTTTPAVNTSQSGTVLYLQAVDPNRSDGYQLRRFAVFNARSGQSVAGSFALNPSPGASLHERPGGR